MNWNRHELFDGDSLDSIIAAVQAGDPRPAHVQTAGVPEVLSLIAARAMAQQPGERFASAAEMAQALRRWVDPKVAAARAASQKTVRDAMTKTRRRYALMALAVGMLVTAAALWVLPVRTTVLASSSTPLPNSLATPLPATASRTTPAAAPTSETAADTVPTPSPLTQASTPPQTAETVAAPRATAATDAMRPGAAPAPVAQVRPPRTTRALATNKSSAAVAATSAVTPVNGVVQMAVSPWGQVEVDGAAVGTTPPLTRLTLPAGTHTIVVRNADFPAFSATVLVDGDKPVVLRHRFGS